MPLSNKGWDEAAACSTDSRPQSRCCRVPTESRAQARGDPKMASDEGDGKVSKSAEEVRDAIVEGSAVRNQGAIAKVVDMMDGKLVISVEGDMEKRLIDCDKNVFKKLKPGFQIGVLPPTMEVLEILPNLEVKSLLLGEKPNVTYGEIGGLMEAIERIKDVVVLPYQEAKLFAQISLEAPRGILLYGPPGCGKTLLVKAIATENDMTFFNVSIADVLSKWVGESERIIKEIFRQAHEKKPSIVFFDEIEALFTVRGMMDTSGVHKNIIAQILSEMDGLVELHDVFVIGATNRADLVDPALLRPGRFDEIIDIPRPDRKAADLTLKDLEMAIDEESKEHAITEMYVYEKRQREVFRTGADPMVG